MIRKKFKSQNTVGGTSLAAFRPGFFLGGSTQVLLNAPFEMTSSSISPGAADKGGTPFPEPDNEGRGARGVASELISGSGNVAIDEMLKIEGFVPARDLS